MRELFESSFLNVMSEENQELRKEIDRLNKIIECLDLYFKYMVDDRDMNKLADLSDRAFNEYITLSIVEDYYNLVKEEPDEHLKEIKEKLKEEGK